MQWGGRVCLLKLLTKAFAVRDNRQFEQAGVKEDDLLVVMRNPSAAPAAARPGLPSAAGFTARPGMKLHEIPVGSECA